MVVAAVVATNAFFCDFTFVGVLASRPSGEITNQKMNQPYAPCTLQVLKTLKSP